MTDYWWFTHSLWHVGNLSSQVNFLLMLTWYLYWWQCLFTCCCLFTTIYYYSSLRSVLLPYVIEWSDKLVLLRTSKLYFFFFLKQMNAGLSCSGINFISIQSNVPLCEVYRHFSAIKWPFKNVKTNEIYSLINKSLLIYSN